MVIEDGHVDHTFKCSVCRENETVLLIWTFPDDEVPYQSSMMRFCLLCWDTIMRKHAMAQALEGVAQ